MSENRIANTRKELRGFLESLQDWNERIEESYGDLKKLEGELEAQGEMANTKFEEAIAEMQRAMLDNMRRSTLNDFLIASKFASIVSNLLMEVEDLRKNLVTSSSLSEVKEEVVEKVKDRLELEEVREELEEFKEFTEKRRKELEKQKEKEKSYIA